MAAEYGSGAGKRCDGKAYSAQTCEAAVAGYDAKLAALGPAKAAAAGYAHAARVIKAAGIPGETADFEARGLLRREWDGRHKQVAAA